MLGRSLVALLVFSCLIASVPFIDSVSSGKSVFSSVPLSDSAACCLDSSSIMSSRSLLYSSRSLSSSSILARISLMVFSLYSFGLSIPLLKRLFEKQYANPYSSYAFPMFPKLRANTPTDTPILVVPHTTNQNDKITTSTRK